MPIKVSLRAYCHPDSRTRTEKRRSRTVKDEGGAPMTEDRRPSLPELRHTAAHVLAYAVQDLFPEAKPTIGPAIENGFYYDFDRAQPFTAGDLEQLEKRMRE